MTAEILNGGQVLTSQSGITASVVYFSKLGFFLHNYQL